MKMQAFFKKQSALSSLAFPYFRSRIKVIRIQKGVLPTDMTESFEPELTRSTREVFLEGVHDGMPIALGYFVVSFTLGIAARNDEHMQVITRLTNALDEPGLIDRLASTQDPQEFLDLLGAEQAA